MFACEHDDLSLSVQREHGVEVVKRQVLRLSSVFAALSTVRTARETSGVSHDDEQAYSESSATRSTEESCRVRSLRLRLARSSAARSELSPPFDTNQKSTASSDRKMSRITMLTPKLADWLGHCAGTRSVRLNARCVAITLVQVSPKLLAAYPSSQIAQRTPARLPGHCPVRAPPAHCDGRKHCANVVLLPTWNQPARGVE